MTIKKILMVSIIFAVSSTIASDESREERERCDRQDEERAIFHLGIFNDSERSRAKNKENFLHAVQELQEVKEALRVAILNVRRYATEPYYTEDLEKVLEILQKIRK